jgi:hypothetical protein
MILVLDYLRIRVNGGHVCEASFGGRFEVLACKLCNAASDALPAALKTP